MGLDITAYSHLRYIGTCPDRGDDEHGYDPDTYEVTHVPAYAYDAFPHALMGVPNQRTVEHGTATFIEAGCFEVTEKTEMHRFRAGSYSGYNRWRADLAERFNPYRKGQVDGAPVTLPPSPEGPFYELIWFADNEGTLSELVATKLLGNFRQFEVEYAASHDEYDVQRYRDWMRAFELAADGGLVDFH